MEALGLQRAGDDSTYLQKSACEYSWLQGTPALEVLDASGQPIFQGRYRQDFSEEPGTYSKVKETTGAVTGLAMNLPSGGTSASTLHLIDADLKDKILVVSEQQVKRIDLNQELAGILAYTTDDEMLSRRYLALNTGPASLVNFTDYPVLLISHELAETLLNSAGTSIADLEKRSTGLALGEYEVIGSGSSVRLQYPQAGPLENEQPCYNVIGYLPGQGALIGSEFGHGGGQDSQVIMITASYDGLGMDDNGTLYPGANDNLSGTAAVLELARAMSASPSKPDKTVVFVLWGGGERGLSLTSKEVMNSLPGFNELTIEAIVELRSLGYGEGKRLVIGEESSYRLYKLFGRAARRLGVDTLDVDHSHRYHPEPVRGDLMGRQAMTLYAHWENPDRYAHTVGDTWETIDLEKIRQAGQTLLLGLQVMTHEESY
jgi:hypothetical protein